jgi:hypothetical protein
MTMRRLYLSLLIGFASLSLVVWGGRHRAAARPARTADATRTGAATGKTLGVASCASMACHNGNGPKGSKGSEYSTWIAVDPHAKAYRTLSKPESQRMHEALARHDKDKKNYGKYASASENPLCLKCHGMGDNAEKDLHTDGVGCEQCHGPAEKWKTTHYLDGFDRTTAGFVDTRDLVTRAKTCVKCHVGDAHQEVNHDLIAAGHPRLRFEFAAYHANYPKHWTDTGEKKRDPGFEARAWVVGQLVSAQAALELLASRTKGKDPITDEEKPWPEFAEYECAACHHGLKKPSFQQKRDLERATKGEKFRPGDLPWGTWYSSLLPILAERVPGSEPKLAGTHKDLERDLRKRLPDRNTVADRATEAAEMLGKWLAKVKDRPLDKREALALFGALARQEAVVESGWDGGAQIYLGLAAMHNALCDLDPEFRTKTGLRPSLLEMRKNLREAFGKQARPLYDSPLNYDPEVVQKTLTALRKGLK